MLSNLCDMAGDSAKIALKPFDTYLSGIATKGLSETLNLYK